MSDETVNNTPVPAPTGKEAPSDAKPAINLDELSGADARALVEEAKAKGIDVQDLIKEKNSAGAPKQESNKDAIKGAAQEAMRRFKVKVDGNEMEVDEQELLRGYSHQKAANKILQEGKAARKQAEEFINMMKDKGSLMDVIRKLGHDPRQLSEEYLASQLEDELLDPRDKELKEARKKLQSIEDMERKQKEAIEKQRNEQLKLKFAEDYNKQFVSALEETGLPPTKPMVAEMAKYIARSAQIGFKMTAVEAAQLVKEDIQMAHQRLIGDADGDMLMKLLGEDVANKIRKIDTSRVKNPEQYLRTPKHEEQGEPREPRVSGKKRMSAAEWREFNRPKKK